MKTKEELEEMLEQTSSSLEEAVIEVCLEDTETDDDIKTFFSDLLQYGCVSGMIGSLIYYKDTIDFFDEHEDEIEDLITESMGAFGYKTRPQFIDSLNGSAESMTEEKNLLSWFAFEETARIIAGRLGLDI